MEPSITWYNVNLGNIQCVGLNFMNYESHIVFEKIFFFFFFLTLNTATFHKWPASFWNISWLVAAIWHVINLTCEVFWLSQQSSWKIVTIWLSWQTWVGRKETGVKRGEDWSKNKYKFELKKSTESTA